MEYPEYAEIDGKEYKIDTDFNTALKCFEVLEDEEITDYERALAIVYLLFDFLPEDEILFIKLLEKAKIFLQCGKTLEEQSSVKKDMDFNQDRSYIMSSFMSDYDLDISKEKLHFWQFIELLEGLTEHTILNRIRDLRNYDLSEEKDFKRRAKIQEAQEKVKLKNSDINNVKKFTEEQIRNIEKFNELSNQT